MGLYKLWDKKEDIYTVGVDKTTGKSRWTADEFIDTRANWARRPQAKVVVAGGDINGMVFASFYQMKERAIRDGLIIPEGATDEEILVLIEDQELTKKRVDENYIPAEERIASALEFQNLMML